MKTRTQQHVERLREIAGMLGRGKGMADQTRAADIKQAADELERLDVMLNTPHTAEFLESVKLEAMHQRERWAAEHDAGKTDADWFWLVGYLTGKALHKPEKQLHHIITTAAALLNWHAARTGTDTRMRPGIAPPPSESGGSNA